VKRVARELGVRYVLEGSVRLALVGERGIARDDEVEGHIAFAQSSLVLQT
jgi:hypothetical protein